MTHHPRRKTIFLAGSAFAIAAALPMLMVGCSEPPPPPVVKTQKAPPPPPPPPKPQLTSIADLMVKYNIDERVVLPEDRAPSTDEERIALLQFFDAFVRGDIETTRTMLGYADQQQLASLVDSGGWDAATGDAITRVELQSGHSPQGIDAVLALYEDNDFNFQAQLWYYNAEEDAYTFEAVSSPPDIVNRLYGNDWIAAWHDILAQELALANQPDELVAMKQVNMDESTERNGVSLSRNNDPGPAPPAPGKGVGAEPVGR